jgi:hypothetical protein
MLFRIARRSCARLLCLAALLGGVAPSASALAAGVVGRPLPGYWEGRDHWSIVITAKTDVKRQCLSAAQVERWMTSPAPKHYTCAYDDKEVGDGRMTLRGRCLDKSGQGGDIVATGTYTPDAFHIDAKLTRLRIGGLTLPVPGSAEIDAHRLSADCPAGMVPET